jgi:hypothetical protein
VLACCSVIAYFFGAGPLPLCSIHLTNHQGPWIDTKEVAPA